MSIHRSLKTQGKLARERNVFTRVERLAVLKKEKRWTDGDSIFGLPKVRTRFKVKAKRKDKDKEKDKAAAEPAATPAPAAKAGKK